MQKVIALAAAAVIGLATFAASAQSYAPPRPDRGASSDARITPVGVPSHDDSPARADNLLFAQTQASKDAPAAKAKNAAKVKKKSDSKKKAAAKSKKSDPKKTSKKKAAKKKAAAQPPS